MFAGVPTVDFDQVSRSKRAESCAGAPRALLYQLLHVDEHFAVLPTALSIANARLEEAGQSPSNLDATLGPFDHANLERRAQELRAQHRKLRDQLSVSVRELSKDQCVHLLKQFAPTALLDGCWLQNFSSAVTSHTKVAASVLELYSHEIGEGDYSQHHGNVFRDLMQSLAVYLPDITTVAFGERRDLADAAFDHPVFLLSISQFPRSFTPEILGLTMFYYVCGISPLYLALRDKLEAFGASVRFFDTHELTSSIAGPAAAILNTVKSYIGVISERSAEEADRHWLRIQRGFNAAIRASRELTDRGVEFMQSPLPSPNERMCQLIARIARYAKGYHPDSKLEGKTLDDWMNPDTLDPGRFLSAFARSSWVSPGDAKGSYFFRKLVSFRGPMFRVFSPEELNIIAEWMNSLPIDAKANQIEILAGRKVQPEKQQSLSANSDLENSNQRVSEQESIERYSKMSLPYLYYHLLNIEYFPDVRPFARYFSKRWLAKAGQGLRGGERPLPFEPYRHEALDLWLDAQHTQQLESYVKNADGPDQTKEELIDSTIQLAPTTLVDGAWIQRAFNAGMSSSVIGSKLFHIYYDEVGNGDTNLNHPNVFRELLAQMDVQLPDFGTLEFSQFPLFREESFRVPVFWLSISQFPQSFLSETLGLNLAMELSGVGGTYRTAIDALKHYGFDPYFVELHNNIDNVSTGHTAWAISAIKYHLDEMFARGGADLVDEHWQRIWTGYRALAPQKMKPTGLQRFIPAPWRD